MPEFATPHSVKSSEKLLTQSETIRAIRFAIASEYEAIQIYEEIIEGVEERVKNMIKFLPGEMHLTKRGPINVHMDFVEKQKNHTDYRTPYGSIVIGLEASKVTLEEEEKRMVLQVDYTLDVNYEYLADCKIHVDIRSLDGEQFSLRE